MVKGQIQNTASLQVPIARETVGQALTTTSRLQTVQYYPTIWYCYYCGGLATISVMSRVATVEGRGTEVSDNSR